MTKSSRNSKPKKRKGLCAHLFRIPNDFEEDVAKRKRKLSEARYSAHESSLIFLGKSLTITKYLTVMCAVVALTAVLALRETKLTLEEHPTTPEEVA